MHASDGNKPIVSFRSALIVALGLVFAHLAFILLIGNNLILRAPLNSFFLSVSSGLATFSLFYAARQSRPHRSIVSLGWMMLAFALLFNTLGEIAQVVVSLRIPTKVYPSPADWLYLLFYPLYVVGILFFIAAAKSGERIKVALDAAIVVIAATLICWTFIIEPIIVPLLQTAETATFAIRFSTINAVSDVVMVLGLLWFLHSWRRSPEPGLILLLAVGPLAKIMADALGSISFFQEANSLGGLIEVGWTFCYALIGLAGMLQVTTRHADSLWSSTTSTPRYGRVHWTSYLPYLWVVAAFSLLVWDYHYPLAIGFATLAAGVGAIIGLILIRQVLALRDNARLYAAAEREIAERKLAEESLRLLQKALETMNLGVTITDLDGKIIYTNPADAQLHGYTVNELLGMPARVFAPPGKWKPIPAAQLKGLKSWQREGVNIRKDGSTFPAQLLSDVVTNAAGEPIGIVTSCLDITERKQAEQALQKAKEDSEIRVAERTAELNAELEERKRAGDRQRIVYQVLRAVSGQLDLDAAVRSAAEAIVKETNYPHVCIALPNAERTHWIVRGAAGSLAAALGAIYPIHQGVIGRAFKTEQTQWVRDILTDPGYVHDVHAGSDAPALRSEFVVPLRRGEQLLGALNIESDHVDAFDQEDMVMIESLGEVIALALENAQLYHELHQSAERFRSVFDNASVGIAMMDASERVLAANDAECRFLGYARDELIGMRFAEFTYPEDLTIDRDLHQSLLAGRQTDDTIDKRYVRRNGQIVWGRLSVSLVRGMASQPLYTLIVCEDITQRKHMEEQLRHLSTHDSLTGLYNRAFFEEELNRLRSSRQFPVSIVMVDVDELKKTNDTRGHAAGDDLLRRAGVVLRAAFRAGDMIARIGGDEFAVLLPQADPTAAQHALRRCREELAEHNAMYEQYPVSLSMGSATATTSENLADALKQADTQMYQDKSTRKGSDDVSHTAPI